MRTNLVVSMLALVGAAFGAQGCGGESVAPDEALGTAESELTRSSDSVTVATARTPASTRVLFVSSADDELGVATIGAIGHADPVLEEARRTAGGDPIKLFEALTGTSAPQALLEAVRRADGGAFRVDASDDGEAAVASQGLGLTGGAAPAAAGGFCNIENSAYSGSGKFTYCWPNMYATPWVNRKADHMSCRFDSVSGPQRVRYRYKSGGSWHTAADYWLSSGQYMEWTGHYKWARRWRECKTVDNPYGRQHHFRVVGHEWLAGVPYNPVEVSFPSP